jgi:hypothetical protein
MPAFMFRFSVVFLCIISQISIAQRPDFPESYLKVGYYGDLLFNPGLTGSYEFTLAEGEKSKTKIKRQREIIKYKFNRLSIAPTAGFFVDPKSQTAVFANASLLYRRINRKGRTLAVGPGMGIYSSIIRNVYSFSNGTVSESGVEVTSYAAPTFRFEIGRFKKKQNYRGWYSAISVQALLNYNATAVLLPAFEFGRTF